jgi:hypothetical protein
MIFMRLPTPRDGKSGWTVVVPPTWCRDDRLVLLELVPERPNPLIGWDPELDESLGLELWRAVASIRRWADSAESDRPSLFARARSRSLEEAEQVRHKARSQAPELEKALDVFTALTTAPADADAGSLVLACRAVVDWAEKKGLEETAIQFAEAAAGVMPESAALANLAGRISRLFGRRGRAELWYDRAIGLSRRTPGKRGIRQYVRARLGFAATLVEIEEHAAALEHIATAATTAKRKGMRGKAAEAFHDAMYLSTMDAQFAKATIFARKAIHNYPFHHHRYPALGHDFALLLLYRGMYPFALSLLNSAVRKIASPAEQLVAWGTLARSAAGAGYQTRFEEATARVDQLVPTFSQTASAGLYSVGEGARLLGNWEMAERYALAAEDAALKSGTTQIVTRSRALLESITHRQAGPSPTPEGGPSDLLLRRLAPAVRLRLTQWRGPTWRPRHLGPEDLDDY